MSIETAQWFPRVGVGSSNVTTAVSPTAGDAGQAVGSLHPSLPHYAPTELSVSPMRLELTEKNYLSKTAGNLLSNQQQE